MAVATRSTAPQSALTFAEKNFRPAAVERDLYDWWERSGFFTPPATPSPGERKFVMMLPLPNVTGDLHLGHALSFGGYEDLMARWHRMKGDATLYLPGSDHAGISAQIVVEKELEEQTTARRSLTREQFLAEMWKWMDYYKPRIYGQLRMLGCSLDWTRVHFTMDPDMQRRVRIHFIRLYRKGHLYRGDRIVHWCIRCQTTYSDLETEHVERTDRLSYVRYPWADGAPAGAPDVVVATTRPETIVADVAVAVHPADERWRAAIGAEVLVPVAERRVRVIADQAVDPSFGTGAVKVTPGHDPADFEIGQRHGLPVITVVDQRGRMTPAAGPLAGDDRDAARADMVGRLGKLGLLLREESITHAVGVHEACGTVDEPLVLKQWWMRMAPLARPAIQAVRDGRVRIIPDYQTKVFFNWMENIRDWNVSRQIWWGHEIPVWYCRDCDQVVVPDEGAPDPTRCPRCASDDLRRDPDVLDAWFSSALWPHSTLGWPERTPDLARFYPGSMLETGWDILFFWVARMIMMGIENMGEVPFRAVYLHGMVRSGTEKMSKSHGNVVSPVGYVEQYGADALRYALVNSVAAGADTNLLDTKLENARNFGNKLWNIGRFVLRQLEAYPGALGDVPLDASPVDRDLGEAERWILSRTEAAVAEADRLIETYLFGEYASFMQHFVWGELADAYIELSKAGLRDPQRRRGTVRTLAYVLDRVLRLLHPLVPFITETLALQLWWGRGTSRDEISLVTARWPRPGERDLALEARFAHALELGRAARALRQLAGIGPNQRTAVTLSREKISFEGGQLLIRLTTGPDSGIAGIRIDGGAETTHDLYASVAGTIVVPKIDLGAGSHEAEIRALGKNASSTGSTISPVSAVAREGHGPPISSLRSYISVLANADITVALGSGPTTAVGSTEVWIEAKRDIAAERVLERELADARETLRRSEELLGRASFTDKAPPAVVQKERARLAERRERLSLLEEELARLR